MTLLSNIAHAAHDAIREALFAEKLEDILELVEETRDLLEEGLEESVYDQLDAMEKIVTDILEDTP